MNDCPAPTRDADHQFSELLRWHRIRAGLTQRALADLSAISSRAIRDLEAGRANARTQTIYLLADGLQLKGVARELFMHAGLSGRQLGPVDVDVGFAVPRRFDALLGREKEVRAMVTVLESGRRRMISICGLPGVGKTRIAAEMAAQLSSRRWPVLWIGTDSRALQGYGIVFSPLMHLFRSLIESSADDLSQLRKVISQHEALLVLDGVADVKSPSGVEELLAYCPGVRVISTSRVPWEFAGLQAAVISPLATPGPELDARRSLDALATVPSVQLLVDRLSEVMPGFELSPANACAAAEICRKLDGLPLALELVAGRFRALSLQQLAEVPVLDLLDLTAPARPGDKPQTIAELLRWSVEHLGFEHGQILRELVRFEQGWTAADVAGAFGRRLDEVVDDLGVLIGYGLVQASHGEAVTALHVPNLLRALLLRLRLSPLLASADRQAGTAMTIRIMGPVSGGVTPPGRTRRSRASSRTRIGSDGAGMTQRRRRRRAERPWRECAGGAGCAAVPGCRVVEHRRDRLDTHADQLAAEDLHGEQAVGRSRPAARAPGN